MVMVMVTDGKPKPGLCVCEWMVMAMMALIMVLLKMKNHFLFFLGSRLQQALVTQQQQAFPFTPQVNW